MSGEQNFSTRLIALRKKHGLSQTELAAELKLSMSYIHQLEAGKRTPSDSLIRLLELWDSQRQRQPSVEGVRPVLQEEATTAYRAAIPFPGITDPLMRRVEKIAAMANVSPEVIIRSAVEQFVQRAETEQTVTLNLKPPTPHEGDTKTKGAA